LLPFFLSIIIGLVKAVTDSSAMLSDHPNRGILSRSFLYTAPIAVAGVINIVLAAYKENISFFMGYSDDQEQCIVSPYYSALIAIFSAVVFLMLRSTLGVCSRDDEVDGPYLNIHHHDRIKKLPLFVILFIGCGILSVGGPYLPEPGPRLVNSFSCIISVVVMVVYLYYLVIAPLREGSRVILPRGSLTLRHGVYLDEPLSPSGSLGFYEFQT
jgi:hypothetical protein